MPSSSSSFEHLADVLVVVDHRVVIRRLPLAGLAEAVLLRVREEVHVRRVQPHEPRLARFLLPLDEVDGRGDELVVAGLHALLGERARVLDLLLANLAPARLDGLVVLVGGPGMDHAARTEVLPEFRVLRVVGHLRLFLGIQVIEVAVEFVESVVGRQHEVQVAEVVLAELAGRVALLLQERRNRHDLFGHADWRGRNADLRQPRAQHALSGDERGSAGRAGLLAVAVREQHALLRDPVDVRRPVAHQAVRIATQVRLTDVVAPDDEDVRLLAARLASFLSLIPRHELLLFF